MSFSGRGKGIEHLPQPGWASLHRIESSSHIPVRPSVWHPIHTCLVSVCVAVSWPEGISSEGERCWAPLESVSTVAPVDVFSPWSIGRTPWYVETFVMRYLKAP